MKPYLLILALMTPHLPAAEPAFPTRPWKTGTPGVTLLKEAHHDNATGTIEVTAGEQALIPLVIDAQPQVGTQSYALRGEVKYEQVGGTGFLETWTTVGGNKSFSRSLAEQGPMAKLTGSSAWRDFALPMNMTGSSEPVQQIEMNVMLPDGGKVWLRHLRLEPMQLGPPTLFPSLMPAGLLLAAIIAAALIWRNKRRRSSETEIKRMMAADA